MIATLGAAMLLSGCTIGESLRDEINRKPTLILGYRYINKDQQNTLVREVGRMNVFVFDDSDRYMAAVEATHDELTAAEGLTILSGVPADHYTVSVSAISSRDGCRRSYTEYLRSTICGSPSTVRTSRAWTCSSIASAGKPSAGAIR